MRLLVYIFPIKKHDLIYLLDDISAEIELRQGREAAHVFHNPARHFGTALFM